jgi:hypothetical protein
MKEFLLSTVCAPGLAHPHPVAQVEIASANPNADHSISVARLFNVFDVTEMLDYAVEQNAMGRSLYLGLALRKHDASPSKRTKKEDALGGYFVWADADTPEQVERLTSLLAKLGLKPFAVATTGTTPTKRIQIVIKSNRFMEPAEIEAINKMLMAAAGSDLVADAGRVMRFPGTVNVPKPEKVAKGYITELATVQIAKGADAESSTYDPADLKKRLSGTSGEAGQQSAGSSSSSGRKKKSRLGLTDDYPASDEEVLADLKEAVDGGQWHNGMIRAAAKLVSMGYSDFAVRKLVSPLCDGGESDPDLDPIIQGAFAKGFDKGREDGGWGGSGTSDDEWGNEASTKKDPRQNIAAAPFVYCTPETLPRREFLYGTHLIRKFLSATIAPGGRGKSSLLMAEAIDMASGGKVFGIAKQKLRVWMWNGEDPLDEMMRKALATMKKYGISQADVEGYLFLNSGRDSEIIIGVETKSGMVINQPVVEDMIETILTNKIDVVQIDPFVSSHRVSENDNTKIDAVAKTFGKIADKTNCAIDLSHYVRKGGPGVVTDISSDDARGAGAMLNAARASRVLNPAALKDAPFLVEAGEAFEPRLHFRVDDGKMNLAKPSSEARWFRLSSVSLDNGGKFQPSDEVGVPVRVEVKGVLDGVTERHLAAVQARLMTMPDGMMKDFRSPHWIGHLVGEVSGLDSKAQGMSAKIDKIVGVWVSTGALVEVTKARKKDKREQVWVKCGHIE